MINAGILDGDLVVVQRAQDARNGEIVVALAGDDESADEATVKRFFRENGPRPAAAGERRPRADLRGSTSRSSAASRECSARCELGRSSPPDARAGAAGAAPRREPRVPRLRRVRAARGRDDHLSRSATRACARRSRRKAAATIRHAGRVTAGLTARGKSGHRRAGRWGDPGGESRRKVAQKGDRLQRFSGDAEGKGEKVG